MPAVTPPSKYNVDDLFLHCELSSFAESGRVDFMGKKNYTIGFMQEGFGFGITNINIDISPSLQPIIEISFKDLYGNLAI